MQCAQTCFSTGTSYIRNHFRFDFFKTLTDKSPFSTPCNFFISSTTLIILFKSKVNDIIMNCKTVTSNKHARILNIESRYPNWSPNSLVVVVQYSSSLCARYLENRLSAALYSFFSLAIICSRTSSCASQVGWRE
jgi:hypothetical protein